MNKTNNSIPLTADLKHRLLSAMAGFTASNFPEFNSGFLNGLIQNGIIKDNGDSLAFDEPLKKRLLKVLANEKAIDLKDFPELDNSEKDFLWFLISTNKIEE